MQRKPNAIDDASESLALEKMTTFLRRLVRLGYSAHYNPLAPAIKNEDLITTLCHELHYEYLYNALAEDFKYGEVADPKKKLDPRIRHYDFLDDRSKQQYRESVLKFFNALAHHNWVVTPMDALENLYFNAACQPGSHVPMIFQRFESVGYCTYSLME